MLVFTLSKDGSELVPGRGDHVSRRDGEELLHTGELGDPVLAELCHLGE